MVESVFVFVHQLLSHVSIAFICRVLECGCCLYIYWILRLKIDEKVLGP